MQFLRQRTRAREGLMTRRLHRPTTSSLKCVSDLADYRCSTISSVYFHSSRTKKDKIARWQRSFTLTGAKALMCCFGQFFVICLFSHRTYVCYCTIESNVVILHRSQRQSHNLYTKKQRSLLSYASHLDLPTSKRLPVFLMCGLKRIRCSQWFGSVIRINVLCYHSMHNSAMQC